MDIFYKMGNSKHFGAILNFLLVFMIVLVGIILYWGLYPYNVVDYKVDYFEMTKEEYKVGEQLTYRTAFCKHGGYSAITTRVLKDGVSYLFPAQNSTSLEGCYDFISSSTEVPNVPEGQYIFEMTVTYQVNPIRTISYTKESKPFMIVR